MNDDLRKSADIRADHRDLTAHRFQCYQAEALLFAGKYKEIRAAQQILQIVLRAEEVYVLLELEFLDQLLYEQALGPFANQKQFSRNCLSYTGEDPHDVTNPLDGAEIRRVHQDLLSVRCIAIACTFTLQALAMHRTERRS